MTKYNSIALRIKHTYFDFFYNVESQATPILVIDFSLSNGLVCIGEYNFDHAVSLQNVAIKNVKVSAHLITKHNMAPKTVN
jgi:hypothetical protein